MLGEVRERFVTISRGQKIAYVVEPGTMRRTKPRSSTLAQDADIFYCEAPFLDQDAEKARERYHLTAQTGGHHGEKSRGAGLVVFHFSPRYTGLGHQIPTEAQQAFRGN